ncbi:MAG TPA: hypothetical protein VJH33_02510 [Candidatus Paceibacterota bacterium]
MSDTPQSGGANEHSKEEKTAVAGGVALLIVVVLFFGWAMLFFKKVQRGTIPTDLSTVAQEQFDLSAVREAQEQLQKNFEAATDEFQTIRKEAEQSGEALYEFDAVSEDDTGGVFGVPAEE